MKVLHIAHSDLSGGAAKASFRIHQSLKKNPNFGINSKMRVIRKLSKEKDIHSKQNLFHNYIYPKLINYINKFYRYGFKTPNQVLHSTAIIKTGLGKELNNKNIYKNIDLLHLHWLGDSTLSIEEIGSLKKPIIWTLHDQWPFCGAEHYIYQNIENFSNNEDKRYFLNYSKKSRLTFESGRDINRLTWLRKKKNWDNNLYIICPSNWMADCAKKSSLFKNNPIFVIPNPLDTKEWLPVNKLIAKEKLKISPNKKIILFGAIDILNDQRKGAHILFEALSILKKTLSKKLLKSIELVAFGRAEGQIKYDLGLPVKFLGHINNNKKLNLIYSAADVFVMPSILESFGQTVSESHACGTPVVGFRTSGLIDIIDHLETGYLALPFSARSLAQGMKWVLENDLKIKELSDNCRRKALSQWDYSIVSSKYYEIYNQIIKNK